MTDPIERGPLAAPDAGHGIYLLDLVGTIALAATTAVTAAWANDATDVASLVVSGLLFLAGVVGFGIGFLRAAGRSRFEVVDLAGVFYLTASAPRAVRRRFLGLWFAQIAIAVAAAALVRPPFQVMAPVFGVGLTTVWASRHGAFPARPGVRRA